MTGPDASTRAWLAAQVAHSLLLTRPTATKDDARDFISAALSAVSASMRVDAAVARNEVEQRAAQSGEGATVISINRQPDGAA